MSFETSNTPIISIETHLSKYSIEIKTKNSRSKVERSGTELPRGPDCITGQLQRAMDRGQRDSGNVLTFHGTSCCVICDDFISNVVAIAKSGFQAEINNYLISFLRILSFMKI